MTCCSCKGNCPNIEAVRNEYDERFEALERMVIANSLPPEDHRLLERLMPALAGLFGPELFRSWQALCSPPIQAMVGTAGRLGSLLHVAAASGASFDGLRVTKVGKKLNARLWKIEKLYGG